MIGALYVTLFFRGWMRPLPNLGALEISVNVVFPTLARRLIVLCC